MLNLMVCLSKFIKCISVRDSYGYHRLDGSGIYGTKIREIWLWKYQIITEQKKISKVIQS